MKMLSGSALCMGKRPYGRCHFGLSDYEWSHEKRMDTGAKVTWMLHEELKGIVRDRSTRRKDI